MERSFAIRVPYSDSYVPPDMFPGTATCPGVVLTQTTQDEYGSTYIYQSEHVRHFSPVQAALQAPDSDGFGAPKSCKYAGILAMGSGAGLVFAGLLLNSKDYIGGGVWLATMGMIASMAVDGRVGIRRG